MMQERIQEGLREAFEFAGNWPEKGVVNDFIPTISNIDPDLLSVCLTDMEGNTCFLGDTDYRYTLQSISKAVMLAYCLEHVPEAFWRTPVWTIPGKSAASARSLLRTALIRWQNGS